jgi:arsenite methyltransferase
MNNENLKLIVKEKYASIAVSNSSCGCCGDVSPEILAYSKMNDDYTSLDGYNSDADLQLGCGVPTEFANISVGDIVLDLGSGAGNDVFVCRRIVGDSGKIIGLDMTQEMIDLANKNKAKSGYENIDFILGEIENIPLNDSMIDVIVSNCVLNLVPDKKKAFSEMYRVLKPNAHFCVSDIVLQGILPEKLKKVAEMYAGCVSGAIQYKEYLDLLSEVGFKNVTVKKEKKIVLPDETFLMYLTQEELLDLKKSENALFSITVYGEK